MRTVSLKVKVGKYVGVSVGWAWKRQYGVFRELT